MNNEEFPRKEGTETGKGKPEEEAADTPNQRRSVIRPTGKAFAARKALTAAPEAEAAEKVTVTGEETMAKILPSFDDRLLWKVIGTLAVAGVVLILALGVNFLRTPKESPSESAGLSEGVKQTRDDVLAEINKAFAELNSAKPSAALKRLQDVQRRYPDTPSLSYLTALAALESGEFELAETESAKSIARHERVAEALALQAVLQTINPQKTLGDPRIRAEELLEKAIAADTANPMPMIGLARLMRARGKSEEAVKLLEGARDRLQPADSSIAVNISIELTKLQALSDDELPSPVPSSQDVAEVVGAAYTAMRRGEFGQSAELLRLSREQLPGELFNHVLHDPAISRFSDEPRLAEFFHQH